MMRPAVKKYSSRIWVTLSQPAASIAGVMNLVRMSDSVRDLLFIRGAIFRERMSWVGRLIV